MADKSYSENMAIESALWNQGIKNIVCVDEVGRGCFAGPVVCAAVIMKPGVRIPFLTDSKKIPKKRHGEFVDIIKKNAIEWCISEISPSTIDEINILQASRLGMKKAIEGLKTTPDFALVDGNVQVDIKTPQRTVISGDYLSHGISAASILAKYYRDNLMSELDERFHYRYGWAKNSGYPTPKHINAAIEYGVTEYHRKSWRTMKKITEQNK